MSKVRHPDPPAVVVGVLAVVGGHALREALEQLAHRGGVDHLNARCSASLDQLDAIAVGVTDEAQPVAAIADRVRRPLGLDPLIGQTLERRVEVGRRDRDVPVPGADLVRL